MKSYRTLSLYEVISFATTRIECVLKDGSESTGTGFFIFLNDESKESEVPKPFLITNKHVIENSSTCKLTLTTMVGEMIDETVHLDLPISNFESFWIPHPNEDIDLCILSFAPIESLICANLKKEIFYLPLNIHMVPNNDTLKSFDTVEDVIMVGYPNGIWDSHNNKPIFRKGVTATDVRLNYENKSEFLIDMAVYGGSSGSPVIYVTEKEKNTFMGGVSIRPIYLLGVLYAGFQHTADGKIKIVEIPHSKQTVVKTSIPNNLGLVIKAEQLYGFREMFYE